VTVSGCRRAQLGWHHIYIYKIDIYVTNLGACLGTQFPTDLLKDPLLSSVCGVSSLEFALESGV
jgi:hypothetical protein